MLKPDNYFKESVNLDSEPIHMIYADGREIWRNAASMVIYKEKNVPICHKEVIDEVFSTGEQHERYIRTGEEIFLLQLKPIEKGGKIVAVREKIFDQTDATLDSLTKVYNRGFLNSYSEIEHKRAVRTKAPLCIIMIDIDHFKKVNDEYGHQTGDTVLRVIATTLKRRLRVHDIIGRFGGEEFMIILPNTDISSAEYVSEKLREEIENIPFATDLKITISAGISFFDPKKKTTELEKLIKKADDALYKSKKTGRNKVTVG